MTIVAVTGDGATTLTLALAAAWPARGRCGDPSLVGDVLVVEADPSGGSLAGWLDTPAQPSLAAVAAAVGRGEPAAETIRTMAHHSVRGVRAVTAPVRRTAARRAIAELPEQALAAMADTTEPVLVDLGVARPDLAVPAIATRAAVVVLAHRQRDDTARAESVRLERLAETAEFLANADVPITLTVTGAAPFDPEEIAAFVDEAVGGGLVATHRLPDDRLAAAVLSGRTGVSSRRFARLPLLRAAAALATSLAGPLDRRASDRRHGARS